MNRFAVLFLSLLCGPFSAAQESPASWELDDDSLRVESERVLEVFAERADPPLGETVTIRLAEPPEIAKALRQEFASQVETMFPSLGPAAIQATARQMATVFSNAVLAKYASGERAILVSAERFEEYADSFDDPAILSAETVRAVLVHECVHALDHRRYDFPAELTELGSVEAIQAYNGIIEGHAQFQARRICEAQGWTDGFATYTACIGRVLSDPSSLEGMMNQVTASGIVWAYRDGERFIETLHRHAGEEAIARAFDEPPATPDLVDHPEWYLDPSSRPESSCDLDAGLAVLLERYPDLDAADAVEEVALTAEYDEEEIDPIEDEEATPEEETDPADDEPFDFSSLDLDFSLPEFWRHQEVTMVGAQLRAALALLPADEVDRIVATQMFNRLVVVTNPGDSNVAIVGGLFEFASEEDASYYREAGERLVRLKDEKMTGFDLLSSEYQALEGPDWTGLLSTKEIEFRGTPLTVRSLLASRSDLVVELVFTNEEMTEPDLRELLEEMLAAAMGGEGQ